MTSFERSRRETEGFVETSAIRATSKFSTLFRPADIQISTLATKFLLSHERSCRRGRSATPTVPSAVARLATHGTGTAALRAPAAGARNEKAREQEEQLGRSCVSCGARCCLGEALKVCSEEMTSRIWRVDDTSKILGAHCYKPHRVPEKKRHGQPT